MRNYQLYSSSVNVDGTDYSGANYATFCRKQIFFFIIVQSMFDTITETIGLYNGKKIYYIYRTRHNVT